MDEQNIFKHPEWKRLLEAISSMLEIGRLYTYEELSEMAGIDIRSLRGRAQFLHCAREVLERYHVHFENVRNQGYRIVQPREQSTCGMARVRSAGRKLKRAARITSRVRHENLTAEESRIMVDLSMRIAKLEISVKANTKELGRLARGVEMGRLPHPLLEAPADDKSDPQVH